MSKSLFTKTTVAAVALLIGVVGCAKKKPDPMNSVSGVIVNDHVKLSPGAVAHVRLADVTRGYVESETVVQKTVRPNEDGTIPFTLEFKEKQIDKSHKYAVDARVVDRNKVIVIGGKGHPVVTHGNPHTVEMDLTNGSKF